MARGKNAKTQRRINLAVKTHKNKTNKIRTIAKKTKTILIAAMSFAKIKRATKTY